MPTIKIADKPTLDNVNTNIGTSTDTGGSSTTGTLMGKLNYMISQGFGNLNYIISQGLASLTGEGTTIYSSDKEISMTGSTSSPGDKCIAKFVAPVSGIYKVTVGAKAQSSYEFDILKIESFRQIYTYSDSSTVRTGYIEANQDTGYDLSNVGEACFISSEYSVKREIDGLSSIFYGDIMPKLGSINTKTDASVSKTFSFYCKAGEQVQLAGFFRSASTSKKVYLNSVNITYQSR